VNEVVGIMQQNMEKVMDRGERFERLEEQTGKSTRSIPSFISGTSLLLLFLLLLLLLRCLTPTQMSSRVRHSSSRGEPRKLGRGCGGTT